MDYNVGIYERLSRDDRNAGESVSIQNQRELLTRYVREHGWNLVSEYVDDGVSGTSFDRPGFNRMMEDAQAGRINLILVKDLSRFGRAQAETTIYIETTFPELGCRFIAVDDDYDTANKTDTSETSMLIKSFLNDFYARDTSKKIKTVKRSTFRTGKYIGAYAPFGYIKDPADKHHFIIDEPAAAIVRKIFSLRSKGHGFRKIAQLLNEDGDIPPREYYYQNLGKANPHYQNKLWNDATVRAVVRNEAYIGHTVQNKRGTVSYKNHKQIDKPKEEWIRVENTHEPIIDMDTWELCQQIDRMHSQPRRTRESEVSLFGGLLYCMDCGFAMRHQTEHHKRKNGNIASYESYLCGNYSRSGRVACSTHSIYLKPLTEIVLSDIRAKAEMVKLDEAAMVQKLASKMQRRDAQDIAAVEKTLKTVSKRLEQLDKLVQSTYEDKVKGMIPEAVCVELLNKYQAERTEKTAQLNELKQQMDETKAVQANVQGWADLIRQYSNLDFLDRETLVKLIEKIEIGETQIVDGQKTRKIRINYKFVGAVG